MWEVFTKWTKRSEIISLVNKYDIAGLANTIEYLLANPEVLKKRAEMGYLRAQEMFSNSDDKIINSLLKAYEK